MTAPCELVGDVALDRLRYGNVGIAPGRGALLTPSEPTPVRGIGVLGVEPESRAVFDNRRVKLPALSMDVAATVKRLGVVRLELDGLIKVRHGAVELTLEAVGETAVRECDDMIELELEGFGRNPG